MPLIIWLWVCNPTLIIVIARQSACRVNIRGNSGHTSASAPHHRPVAQRIAGPVRAWHLYPRWGPENVAHLSHLNPARTKPDRRSVFNTVEISDTSGPHQVEGNLWICSVRSSSMRPGGLCLPVSRSASYDGQSHAAADPARTDRHAAAHAARSDVMRPVRSSAHGKRKEPRSLAALLLCGCLRVARADP